jgi:hypothetical protein
MTGGEAVYRVRVALEEMGWGDLKVEYEDCLDEWCREHLTSGEGYHVSVAGPAPLPGEIIWMAFKVSDLALGCWTCWSGVLAGDISVEDYRDCYVGECRHTGCPYPPRDKLVARR